jgi:uncharacterized damage-inducible protein DinB
MTWTSPTPDPHDGPLTGADRPILEAYLAWQRATLLNICAGLTGEQLAQRPLPSTNLSLLGLVRHLAKVERTWFRERAAAQHLPPFYDPSLGVDADFDDLNPEEAENDFGRLETEWRLADLAASLLDFEHTVTVHGQPMSLRLLYVHMIGEYARHNGHADLLREALDGVTGR